MCLLAGCASATPTPPVISPLSLTLTSLVQTQAAVNLKMLESPTLPVEISLNTETPLPIPSVTLTTFLSKLPGNNPTQTSLPLAITETPMPSLATPTISSAGSAGQVAIITVNKSAEFVDIVNNGALPQDLSGWTLVSVTGNQSCLLSGTIQPNEVLRIFAQVSSDPGFYCGFGANIWNNSKSDPAVLYNSQGVQVSQYP